ncbi:hypothetical protein L6452_03371 [Arctium lappa]|uniref:Uncharacterized protein n=1 Tax=Arctium lappa TaxID=4217 RepID=A0ACB9FMX3_ARCLA|nr:hypothetical protein L6452_03371 [Arctium lappa]
MEGCALTNLLPHLPLEQSGDPRVNQDCFDNTHLQRRFRHESLERESDCGVGGAGGSCRIWCRLQILTKLPFSEASTLPLLFGLSFP